MLDPFISKYPPLFLRSDRYDSQRSALHRERYSGSGEEAGSLLTDNAKIVSYFASFSDL